MRFIQVGLALCLSSTSFAYTYYDLKLAMKTPKKVTDFALVVQSASTLKQSLKEMKKLPKLTKLTISSEVPGGGLDGITVPDDLCGLKTLEYLEFSAGQTSEMNVVLPDCLPKLSKLKTLKLDGSKLDASTNSSDKLKQPFPAKLTDMPSVKELSLRRFRFKELPEQIRKFKNLRTLNVYMCYGIHALPKWIGDFQSLEELSLNRNQIQDLPDTLSRATNLRTVHLQNNAIKLAEQKEMIQKYPQIHFDFANDDDFGDGSENEKE